MAAAVGSESNRNRNGRGDNDGDSDSDYGWDLSLENDVHQLLNTAADDVTSPHGVDSTSPGSPPRFVSNDAVNSDVDSLHAAALLHMAMQDYEVKYPDLSKNRLLLDSDMADAGTAAKTAETAETADTADPARLLVDNSMSCAGRAVRTTPAPAPTVFTANSPLARFRTFPRKPLSVSDLTAGAWCELQYEYTLTRLPFGRRTRTPAMRAGTRVHARLEEEVHTTVRVEVTKREDFLGIKMWNMIQGLRTLRETGLTREFEIWGVVDAGSDEMEDANASHGDDNEASEVGARNGRLQLVNGIIDALSYHNPDPALDDDNTLSPHPATTSPSKSRITDFFPSSQGPPSSASYVPSSPSTGGVGLSKRKVYITDIKTRGSPRLPTGAAVRPTKIQLFLYHRFLSTLAAGRFDFGLLARRNNLDPDASFSDTFLAQIGGVHDEIFEDAATSPLSDVEGVFHSVRDRSVEPGEQGRQGATPADDRLVDIIRYRTLRSLAGLLQDEVALTFPEGAESVGGLVAVEYRLRAARPWPSKDEAKTRAVATPATATNDGVDEDGNSNSSSSSSDDDPDAGRCIGTNVMAVDDAVLDRYLQRYMEWWRGARQAVGVEIEEASLKCGYCEFADACDWRESLDHERVQRVREKVLAARQQ